MRFSKFNSIENSYRVKFIEEIKKMSFDKLDYIVQEKIHGANFSFITNGTTIHSANRSELLEEGRNFYNFQKIQQKYTQNILSLFKEVKQNYPQTESINIFGELFGGTYPHPEVAKDPSASRIQKGIFYCAHNDFIGFDIMINNETYLSVEAQEYMFKNNGFIYCKTLFKGSLNECLAYPNEFQTTIPSEFNLPPLEGNICEGVVIRPVVPLFFGVNTSRVILKNKNERWSEKKEKPEKEISQEIQGSQTYQFLVTEVIQYVTENRLSNVLSKIGPIEGYKEMGKLIHLLTKDVSEDFEKDFKNELNTLEKAETKMLSKTLNKESVKLIKEYLSKNY